MPAPTDTRSLVQRMIDQGLVQKPTVDPSAPPPRVPRGKTNGETNARNIWTRIREMAARHATITALDFPDLPRSVVKASLYQLCHRGELRMVRRGRPGAGGQPAKYAKIK